MKQCLCAFLLILFAAGCRKESTVNQNNIKGTWQVYKYYLNGLDQTLLFQDEYDDYTITFNGAGAFTENYHSSVDTFNIQGTYYFTNYYQELVLVEPIVDSMNGVVHDTAYQRQYNIFDLTGVSVQLQTDTSQLYLQKK